MHKHAFFPYTWAPAWLHAQYTELMVNLLLCSTYFQYVDIYKIDKKKLDTENKHFQKKKVWLAVW